MIAGSILAWTLMGALGHDPALKGKTVLKPAGWTVVVDNDAFTGKTACTLTKDKVSAVNGWVTLHLGRNVDTELAEVRIDAGQARGAHQLPRPPLDPNDTSNDPVLNPSGGRVLLPETEVAAARAVYVRPNRGAHIRRFDVAGLVQALDAAAKAGCPADEPVQPRTR